MLDKELLEILACPETKAPVVLAAAEVVARVNEAIRRGGVVNRGGQKVAEVVDALLIRSDQAVAYPVRDGVPIMLAEEAIVL